MNKFCCTCRYGALDGLADRICVNSHSENCADWVGDFNTCNCWEKADYGTD